MIPSAVCDWAPTLLSLVSLPTSHGAQRSPSGICDWDPPSVPGEHKGATMQNVLRGNHRVYRASNQVRRAFRPVTQHRSGRGTGRHAEIIPLNARADSPRNTTPAFDGSYATPPPITPPYGWILTKPKTGTGWILVHHRPEWSVISWLVQERREGGRGRSYDSLAAELQRDGVPAPTGGRSVGRWHGERVRSLIRLYAPELAAPPRAQRGSRLAQLYELDPATMTDEEKAEMEILEEQAMDLYDAEHADEQ
jgi:hypothetical protein